MQIVFRKYVSKGSQYNQIYIPKELESKVGVGDLVEVILIKKAIRLFYSSKLNKLSKFKENLIKDLFSFLEEKDYKKIFLVGSFLKEKVDYRDIDVIIIGREKEKLYSELINNFNLKFHLIFLDEEQLEKLLKICPLTRLMFSDFVSNTKFQAKREKIVESNYIKSLLMMPKDLLEVYLGSRVLYDNLRRLLAIENFLESTEESLDTKLKDLLGEKLYQRMKENKDIDGQTIKMVRYLLKEKIKIVEDLLDKWEKKMI